MFNSIKVAVIASLTMFACVAQAELVIQSAQYKAEKDALYVKGKLNATPNEVDVNEVYVVQGRGRALMVLGVIEVDGNQFRSDLPIAEGRVPCMIQVQTDRPSRRQRVSGAFNVAKVRHAPQSCLR